MIFATPVSLFIFDQSAIWLLVIHLHHLEDVLDASRSGDWLAFSVFGFPGGIWSVQQEVLYSSEKTCPCYLSVALTAPTCSWLSSRDSSGSPSSPTSSWPLPSRGSWWDIIYSTLKPLNLLMVDGVSSVQPVGGRATGDGGHELLDGALQVPDVLVCVVGWLALSVHPETYASPVLLRVRVQDNDGAVKTIILI